MARTRIKGKQLANETVTGNEILNDSVEGIDIKDGSIQRIDVDTTTPGQSIITKVIAGTGVSIDSSTGADVGTGDVTISMSPGGGVDEKSKISATDTTTGFLETKIVAGNNVTLTKQNTGANENIKIDVNTSGGIAANAYMFSREEAEAVCWLKIDSDISSDKIGHIVSAGTSIKAYLAIQNTEATTVELYKKSVLAPTRVLIGSISTLATERVKTAVIPATINAEDEISAKFTQGTDNDVILRIEVS